MEDQEKAQIRVAQVFSKAVAKILRYSLNDKFRSECFDAFGVSNTDDFQNACEEETLRNIRPKSHTVKAQENKRYVTLPKDHHDSISGPSHDTEDQDENHQPEIEVIELDSSDDEGLPTDDQLTSSSQLAHTATPSQLTSMSQWSPRLSKSPQQPTSFFTSSQQSTCLSKSSPQSSLSKSSQQSTCLSKSSQQSTLSTSSQQSTPPLLSQLF